MVKPARIAKLAPPPQTRGTVKAHKHFLRSKTRAGLKQQWHSLQQPVAGTAKAGGQGSGQGQGQGGKDEVMEEKGLEDFLSSGRTGRRNAMHDISDEKVASVTTAQLPLDMAKLSCAEGGASSSPGQGATSGQSSSKPS